MITFNLPDNTLSDDDIRLCNAITEVMAPEWFPKPESYITNWTYDQEHYNITTTIDNNAKVTINLEALNNLSYDYSKNLRTVLFSIGEKHESFIPSPIKEFEITSKCQIYYENSQPPRTPELPIENYIFSDDYSSIPPMMFEDDNDEPELTIDWDSQVPQIILTTEDLLAYSAAVKNMLIDSCISYMLTCQFRTLDIDNTIYDKAIITETADDTIVPYELWFNEKLTNQLVNAKQMSTSEMFSLAETKFPTLAAQEDLRYAEYLREQNLIKEQQFQQDVKDGKIPPEEIMKHDLDN